VRGGAAAELETELTDETERFFRALLLAVGARAPAGTVVTVERRAPAYTIALEPATAGILEEIGGSTRLVLFGLEAGLALAPGPAGGLAIAPLLPRSAAEPGNP
jgi:hypothetical protein